MAGESDLLGVEMDNRETHTELTVEQACAGSEYMDSISTQKPEGEYTVGIY